ncbi:MAG: hypothetical protein ACKOPN_03405 [Prochlorococcaceae cyanobacterium]
MGSTPVSAPKGHIWYPPLQAWIKPIPRRPGLRPSAEHVLCTEPILCWVLMR